MEQSTNDNIPLLVKTGQPYTAPDGYIHELLQNGTLEEILRSGLVDIANTDQHVREDLIQYGTMDIAKYFLVKYDRVTVPMCDQILKRMPKLFYDIIDHPERISNYTEVIHYIVATCSTNIIEYAISNCHLDSNDSGNILIHLIKVRPRNSRLIIQLIGHEHINLNLVDADDRQAIHCAIQYSTNRLYHIWFRAERICTKWMQKNGSGPLCRMQGRFGNILVIAPHIDLNKLYCNQNILQYVSSNFRDYMMDTCKYLVGGNINLEYMDDCGMRAIHYACRCGEFSLVKLLVQAGADINCQSDDGSRFMIRNKSWHCREYRTRKNWPPIHYAIESVIYSRLGIYAIVKLI